MNQKIKLKKLAQKLLTRWHKMCMYFWLDFANKHTMMGIDSCGMLISAVHHEGEEEKLHLLQVDPHIPAGAKLY